MASDTHVSHLHQFWESRFDDPVQFGTPTFDNMPNWWRGTFGAYTEVQSDTLRYVENVPDTMDPYQFTYDTTSMQGQDLTLVIRQHDGEQVLMALTWETSVQDVLTVTINGSRIGYVPVSRMFQALVRPSWTSAFQTGTNLNIVAACDFHGHITVAWRDGSGAWNYNDQVLLKRNIFNFLGTTFHVQQYGHQFQVTLGAMYPPITSFSVANMPFGKVDEVFYSAFRGVASGGDKRLIVVDEAWATNKVVIYSNISRGQRIDLIYLDPHHATLFRQLVFAGVDRSKVRRGTLTSMNPFRFFIVQQGNRTTYLYGYNQNLLALEDPIQPLTANEAFKDIISSQLDFVVGAQFKDEDYGDQGALYVPIMFVNTTTGVRDISPYWIM